MTTQAIVLKKYTADEGKVFEWVAPQFDEDGNEIHLNAHTLFLGENDDISNYKEVTKEE